jgi:hypothetical protein
MSLKTHLNAATSSSRTPANILNQNHTHTKPVAGFYSAAITNNLAKVLLLTELSRGL